jgi:hypothetical protein
MKVKRWLLVLVSVAKGVLVPGCAFASWTPLISSGWQSGIVTDLGTAATGILACAAIILGIGLLLRAIGR